MLFTNKPRGFAVLDNRIAELGKDNVIADIVSRIANGDSPKSIAQSYDVPYYCIRAFIEEECSEEVALAMRARADVVEHIGTSAVLEADADGVAVARLKGEYLLKLAGKLDRAKYGDRGDGGYGGVPQLPTFVVNFVGSNQPMAIENVVAGGVIANMEAARVER